MKKIFNLENLIYLTILALPSYLLRFNLGIFHVNLLDGLLILCIFIWAIRRREKSECALFLKRRKEFICCVAVIFLGLVISVLVGKNYSVGLGIIKSWYLLPIAFSLVVRTEFKYGRIENVFLVYYISAFVVSLISLWYYFLGVLTFDFRLQGFFNSPNYLAMYLAPAIFIGYDLFSKVRDEKKLFVIGSGLSVFYALYLTYSYASWAAILIAIAIVLVAEKEMKIGKALIIIIIVSVLCFFQIGKDKFSYLASGNSRSSLASRIMIWHSAENMLESNWLWGIGAGNFQETYLIYQKDFPPYLEWAVPHPHNLYLAWWLYGGILGLAGFIMLICFWFRGLFELQKNPSLKLMGLGIMCYILLHGLVDTTYFKNDLAVVFWLLFALF